MGTRTGPRAHRGYRPDRPPQARRVGMRPSGRPDATGGAPAPRAPARRRGCGPAHLRAPPRTREPITLVAAPPGRGDRGAEARARPAAAPRAEPRASNPAVAAGKEAHAAVAREIGRAHV